MPSGPTRCSPADLLLAGGLAQADRDLGVLERLAQVLVDRGLGFVDRLVEDVHLAVGRPQVDQSAGIDRILPADRLIQQRAGHRDLQHVERLDVVGGLGDQLDGVDQQDVRRLDDVGRQRAFVFFGGHAGHPGIGGDARLGLGRRLVAVVLTAHRQRRLAAQGGHHGHPGRSREDRQGPQGHLADGKPADHGGGSQRLLVPELRADKVLARPQRRNNRHRLTNRQTPPKTFGLFTSPNNQL